MTNPLWLLAGIICIYVVVSFNLLIQRRNAADHAFASIDAYLLMRYDLIPNLVATVKAYTAHERSTLEVLTALRSEALTSSPSVEVRVRLDNRIAETLSQVLLRAEAYPDLKASEPFLQLQRSLNEVEERLSAARRAFNAAVTAYNNAVQQVPTNWIARLFRFQSRSLLALPSSSATEVPQFGHST